VSIPYKPDDTVEESVGSKSMRSPLHSYNPGNSIRNCSARSYISKESHDSVDNIANLMSGILSQGSADGIVISRNFSSKMLKMPHLKILLVDDSVMIRKATSRSLIKEGHEVELAQHGAECLKKLEASKIDLVGSSRFTFDLILMDLQMPVMDGVEATKRIRVLEQLMAPDQDDAGRSTPNRPHITIIGISANTVGEAQAECMASGMDGFIEKPLKMITFQEYYLKLVSAAEGSNTFLVTNN
jgi:CheY-like chemotaxis protein